MTLSRHAQSRAVAGRVLGSKQLTLPKCPCALGQAIELLALTVSKQRLFCIWPVYTLIAYWSS
jgi:hypothetical protein